MIKAVLDTNVYISALNFGGIPYNILEKAIEGKFKLFISEEIITEVLAVSAKKFNYSDQRLKQVSLFLRDISVIVQPKITINIIKRFPADNRIIECAVGVKADYLVTGDKKHILPLKKYKSTRIITPEEFYTIISSSFSTLPIPPKEAQR